MVENVIVVYTFKQQFRVQLYGSITVIKPFVGRAPLHWVLARFLEGKNTNEKILGFTFVNLGTWSLNEAIYHFPLKLGYTSGISSSPMS